MSEDCVAFTWEEAIHFAAKRQSVRVALVSRDEEKEQEFANQVKISKTLRRLKLSEYCISDEFAKLLSGAVCANPVLESLDLSRTRLTLRGVTFIVEMFEASPVKTRLKRLALHDNDILTFQPFEAIRLFRLLQQNEHVSLVTLDPIDSDSFMAVLKQCALFRKERIQVEKLHARFLREWIRISKFNATYRNARNALLVLKRNNKAFDENVWRIVVRYLGDADARDVNLIDVF